MPTPEMQQARQVIASKYASYREQANKWYKSSRWQSIRKQQLSRHPYCQCPHHAGGHVKAEVVDHIEPHRGDSKLFWNTKNLQSMSKQCHDAGKQKFERSGYWSGCDENGNPIDQNAGWWKD